MINLFQAAWIFKKKALIFISDPDKKLP